MQSKITCEHAAFINRIPPPTAWKGLIVRTNNNKRTGAWQLTQSQWIVYDVLIHALIMSCIET